jgi:site-specific recombinase XerD
MEAYAEFMLNQRANDLAPKTLKWYGMLKIVLSSLGITELERVTRRDMRHCVIAIQEKHPNESTSGAYKRQLHKFWKWASEEYGISNPMHGIKYPAMPKPHPKAMSKADLKRMIYATEHSVMGARDRAMLLFTYDTGCRRGGVCDLKTENLRIDEGVAIVTEKGNKTRKVYFCKDTAEFLRTWDRVRQHSEWFFYSMQGGRHGTHLTGHGMYLLFRRLAKKGGVKGAFNPHSLRHRFAIDSIDGGGEMAVVSKIMGHARVSTTIDHYLIFTEKELGDLHDKFSPVKKMNISSTDWR